MKIKHLKSILSASQERANADLLDMVKEDSEKSDDVAGFKVGDAVFIKKTGKSGRVSAILPAYQMINIEVPSGMSQNPKNPSYKDVHTFTVEPDEIVKEAADTAQTFKSGDKVSVKNAKKYDSMATANKISGTVDFIWPDGRVAVTVKSALGTGQMNVDAVDIIPATVKEAERFSEPLAGYHIVYRKTGQLVFNTPSFQSEDTAQKYLMQKMFANHHNYKVVPTSKLGMSEDTGTPSAPQPKTYVPRISAWFVRPRSRHMYGKYFALNKEKEARAFAADVDGTVEPIDQFGAAVLIAVMVNKSKQLHEVVHALDFDPAKKIIVHGVKGMKNAAFIKKFKDAAEYEKWLGCDESHDCAIHKVTNEENNMKSKFTSSVFSIKEALEIVQSQKRPCKYHVVSVLDGRVLASYETQEQAEEKALGNPVVCGDIEHVGDVAFVKEQDDACDEGSKCDEGSECTDDECEEHSQSMKLKSAFLCIDVPLLIKLLEYAREESADDEQLHKIAEKIMHICMTNESASMDDYEDIIKSDESDEEDED